jgi:hypothetical protein
LCDIVSAMIEEAVGRGGDSGVILAALSLPTGDLGAEVGHRTQVGLRAILFGSEFLLENNIGRWAADDRRTTMDGGRATCSLEAWLLSTRERLKWSL